MYDRILVPLDGSETSQRGLHEAIALARRLGSSLLLLHVVDDFPLTMEWSTAESFDESMKRLRTYGTQVLSDAAKAAAAEGVACESRLRDIRQEPIAHSILGEASASGCKLIVMGTHGWRGLKRLSMGSDAELVVRSSTVPVLLVRAAPAAVQRPS